MAEFFIPRTGEFILSTGAKQVVVAGVRDLPDFVANDAAANRYGIKPVHEMTADERADLKMPPAPPDVDEAIKVEPEAEADREVPQKLVKADADVAGASPSAKVIPPVANASAATAKLTI